MTDAFLRPTLAVGVDNTPEAMDALRYGAAVAQDRHWDLLVVHAYQIPPAGLSLTARILDELRAGADALVEQALSGLGVSPDTQVHRLVTAESPVLTLRDVSTRAAMLVLGRHHFGFGHQLLGRVGSAVAAHAGCPLVVVPPGWSQAGTEGRPVVVALDAEHSAWSALSAGCDEAELHKISLIALHAVPARGEDSFLSEEEAALGELVAGAKQDHPDVDVQTLLMAGDPQAWVLEETFVAGLMVVGRPHHRYGLGAWSGSMARAVMDRSHCPLLIAPEETRELAGAGLRTVSGSGS